MDSDLFNHSVYIVHLVSSDQCPDDMGHSVHLSADGLPGTKTALDHSPLMERKGGVMVAGGLRNQVEHSSLLVVAPGGQMCFIQRSSRLVRSGQLAH